MRTSPTMTRVMTALAEKHGITFDSIGAHLKLENPPYMPLSIEVVGRHLVSVTHYGEQNGDLMSDPDMVFYTNTGRDGWAPMSYRNDYVGVWRESAVILHGSWLMLDAPEQSEQASFADEWAANIEAQGFLDAQAVRKGQGE